MTETDKRTMIKKDNKQLTLSDNTDRPTEDSRQLTLSNSQLDLEVNWSTDNRLGYNKNILETNDDDQIRKYLTGKSNSHNNQTVTQQYTEYVLHYTKQDTDMKELP